MNFGVAVDCGIFCEKFSTVSSFLLLSLALHCSQQRLRGLSSSNPLSPSLWFRLANESHPPPAIFDCCCEWSLHTGPSHPPRLLAYETVQPLCAGYINPTLPPYNAFGDGAHDDTSALQSASDDAYLASMTLLLPGGRTFLLSHQLLLLQRYCYPPCGYVRGHGMQVVGGGDAGGLARPIVRLQDNATVANGIFIMYDAVGADNSTTGEEASQYQYPLAGH
jgi:hypothetical protein